MTIGTILLILLVLAIIGSLPVWPHSRRWGYRPSGIMLVIVLGLSFLWPL